MDAQVGDHIVELIVNNKCFWHNKQTHPTSQDLTWDEFCKQTLEETPSNFDAWRPHSVDFNKLDWRILLPTTKMSEIFSKAERRAKHPHEVNVPPPGVEIHTLV
jgi:hypothetical protein